MAPEHLPLPVLLFDADCGFCSATATRVPLLRLRCAIKPMQSIDLAAHGVDPRRALREMPVIDAAGVVHWGHLGWAAALATGPLPYRVAGAILRHRPVEPLARLVYRWIATHRHLMPGGTAACALPSRPA